MELKYNSSKKKKIEIFSFNNFHYKISKHFWIVEVKVDVLIDDTQWIELSWPSRRIPGNGPFVQMSLFLMHSGSFREIRGTVRFFVNSTQLVEFVFVPRHVLT